MSTFTLRYRAAPNDAVIARVEAAVRGHDGRITWKRNAAPLPSYALVEFEGADSVAEFKGFGEADVARGPIIALALSPLAPEALPFLEEALAGRGAPAAVSLCERFGNVLLLEWNLERASALTVMALIDVELLRVKCGRTTHLLAPLSLESWTRIAAEGLQVPEIAPDRVLESLLERHGVID